MRFAIPLVAAALLLLAGCDNSNDAEKSQPATGADTETGTAETTVTQPAEPVAPLDSHTESLTRTAEHCEEDDCLHVSIQWLQFQGRPELNAAIRQRLVQQLAGTRAADQPAPKTLEDAADTFVALADNLPDGASRGWQLNADVQSLARHGNLLTLAISSYEFTGGAHGLPSSQWLNWNLATHQAVPLTALIQPGKQAAFQKLARQAHEKWLEEEAEADADFRQAWPYQKTDDYRLTSDGIVLLYQVYTIAPYVMGQPELLIPWEQAKTVIRPAYLLPES